MVGRGGNRLLGRRRFLIHRGIMRDGDWWIDGLIGWYFCGYGCEDALFGGGRLSFRVHLTLALEYVRE